jgi:hypothetical protein
MNNRFSLESYHGMLVNALKIGYRFVLFNEIPDVSGHLKVCLLRHDIDTDLRAALEMAKVEAAIGIRSTYFLMTRSPVYNLTARHNHVMVKEIISLGHGIGLHYDQGFNPGKHKTESEWIAFEAEWIEQSFNIKTEVVSFHQPGSAVLQGKVETDNRINTYNASHLPGFQYYSDSNRRFELLNSFKKKCTIVESFENIQPASFQLLIHPMWWVYEDDTTDEVWNRVIVNNFEMSQLQFLETERAYGSRRYLTINYIENSLI